MAAGYRVYSFDWMVFSDLTSNPESDIPSVLGEALLEEKTRKKLRIPSKRLPQSRDELATVIRDLFLKPEWYAKQPPREVELRHRLLFGMFFDNVLKSIGLSARPAWRKFHECCDFNLGSVLAGQAVLDLERMKRNDNACVYIRYVAGAEPDDNPFRWFGNRPYRYGTWRGSNEDQEDLEEECGQAVHSIQSPDDVKALSRRLAEESDRCKSIPCKELHEAFSDYEHCIEGVRSRNAGMLVEIDT